MNFKALLKKLNPWFPFIALELCSVITVALCHNEFGEGVLTYLVVLGTALIPGVIALIDRIFKLRFPPLLTWVLSFQIYLACDLGNALAFYDKFRYWDTFLHANFGFVSSVLVYFITLKARRGKAEIIDYVWLFFIVVGISALWEVYEFTGDILLDRDAQDKGVSIVEYGNPIVDTMSDIIVTMVGTAVFYLTLLADKLCHNAIYRSFKPTIEQEKINGGD